MTRPKIIERVDLLENKVLDIYEKLDTKMEKRSVDTTPILDSQGFVTSDGIYRALLEKQDKLTIDYQLNSNSNNPIANSAVTNRINQIANSMGQDLHGIWFITGPNSSQFIVPNNVYFLNVEIFGAGGGGSGGYSC